ncbi:MAG: peptidoglycan bridge formation glycyltransferase FemA/FemB family protein [Chloroflexi bacterium]|nr:peptidoglycan bridge formation glycyltransferase FemA/FemB family protein [Chloroflexota bacterium]MCY4246123.1 peptidoglycan bridge formation glycyltransferase FemA/FemB family protein [Chloroflexota bacterium]
MSQRRKARRSQPALKTIPPGKWAEFVARQPRAHILQLMEWGKLKDRFDWDAYEIAFADLDGIQTSALTLVKDLPMRLGKMAYVPMGPYAEDGVYCDALWFDIRRETGAAFLKVEPGHLAASETLDLRSMGFRPSPQTIQPPRTIIIDIGKGKDALLAGMNQSTRRKIRKSLASDLRIRTGTQRDLRAFCQLMQETSERNSFGVHSAAYYEMVFALFMPRYGTLLLAELAGELLAGVMVFALGGTAWYLYGASARARSQVYASYGLQWAAINWAKSRRCHSYDMWGVPDYDKATLEAQFRDRRDGLWGVYGFKRGWGGEVRRTMGAWDLPFSRPVYAAYQAALRARKIGFFSP